MSAARIEGGEGRFAVSGTLTRDSVTELWRLGAEEFSGQPSVELDLAQVSKCDSAGVAMLVDWLGIARRKGQELHFRSVPAQMLAIAQVCDLLPLFEEAEIPEVKPTTERGGGPGAGAVSEGE